MDAPVARTRVTRVPPRWVRRVILAPLVVILAVAIVVADPILLLVGLVVTALLPGFLRVPRIILLVTLYLLWDALMLIALFALWVGSGFGWKLRTPGFQRAHYSLMALGLRILFAAFTRLLRLKIVAEGAPSFEALFTPGTPLVVASRHGGPGDSFILVDTLINRVARNPRIVLKDTLQWDPAIDVILNRLPAKFIAPSGFGRTARASGVEARIGRLASGMGPADALLIFPEGGNFTTSRRLARIDRLRELGRTTMAGRAVKMRHVMAPQPGGLYAALAAAPDADVVFIAHTGLDRLVSLRDIWRELPMDKEIVLHAHRVPRASVPSDREDQARWLFDEFARIDAWIDARNAAWDIAHPEE